MDDEANGHYCEAGSWGLPDGEIVGYKVLISAIQWLPLYVRAMSALCIQRLACCVSIRRFC